MIKHVQSIKESNEKGYNVSYCNKKISDMEWYFIDADNLVSSILDKSLIKYCKNCRNAIIKILEDK